jgi:endonuclease/exonuclease/phosphatase family metal-dependent hydrolase
MQLLKSSAAAELVLHSSILPPNIFWITSQCFGIPEAIQRPLKQEYMKVHQFNIADGSVGLRGDYMLQWLQRKANEGVMFIGFCELVHWQHLVSKQEMVKNVPVLRLRAANAGYVYSHMTTPTPTSSYPLGLVSIYPFQVIKEYEAPHFQRAVLHVYFPNLHYHVFIIHFHAHSSTKRLQEVQYLIRELTPLLNQQAKILIMGDFNTLSPLDRL